MDFVCINKYRTRCTSLKSHGKAGTALLLYVLRHNFLRTYHFPSAAKISFFGKEISKKFQIIGILIFF